VSETRRIRLEVFSDYTCPWCYVGWARLEEARSRLEDPDEVLVTWRPFEIHPDVPEGGMPVEELGYPEEQWARMQEALRAQAADAGLEVGRRPKVANTHRALAAGAWAQTERTDRFPAFHERLFTGYFAEGRDLGDPEVLRELAADAGLDPDAMDAALDAGAGEEALSATREDAGRMGITGTPTFVFDRRLAVSGAQSAETLLRGVEAARAARAEDATERGAN